MTTPSGWIRPTFWPITRPNHAKSHQGCVDRAMLAPSFIITRTNDAVPRNLNTGKSTMTTKYVSNPSIWNMYLSHIYLENWGKHAKSHQGYVERVIDIWICCLPFWAGNSNIDNKREPRLCRQGYAYPQFHNKKDKCCSPKKFKNRYYVQNKQLNVQ